MPYFYIPKPNIKGELAIFTPEESHHIRDVLRHRQADIIKAVDGEGTLYEIELIRCEKRKPVEGKIIASQYFEDDLTTRVTLACAIPKKNRMDILVEKATEIGVAEIIPMITERTENTRARIARWNKIAINAIKQARRFHLPVIHKAHRFDEVLDMLETYDIGVIAATTGERCRLRDVLQDKHEILALVGPEGDFTKDELELSIKKGFVPISLGRYVLRTETAGIVIVATILYELNEIQKGGT